MIGRTPAVTLPITFTALDMRFSITSQVNRQHLSLFFRDDGAKPVQMLSRTDVAELIARLGGEGAAEERKLNFTYGEVLAILQRAGRAEEARRPGQRRAGGLASFMLQENRGLEDQIFAAPVIEDARPQADASGAGGSRPTGEIPGDLLPAELAPAVSGAGPGSLEPQGRPQ